MRGLVLKNHFTTTAGRAALTMARVEGLEIFGGVVLNRAMGGLNIEAVRHMVWDTGGRGKVVSGCRRSTRSTTSRARGLPSRPCR